jgi:hypothetical protein
MIRGLQHLLTLADGRHADRRAVADANISIGRSTMSSPLGADVDVDRLMTCSHRWESVLIRLEQDPMLCARELDWVAKLASADVSIVTATDSSGSDAKLHAHRSSVQRHQAGEGALSARLAATLAHRTPARRRRRWTMRSTSRPTTLVPTSVVGAWRSTPSHVAAASWDSVIFDLPGRDSLQRIPRIDPLRGTRASRRRR